MGGRMIRWAGEWITQMAEWTDGRAGGRTDARAGGRTDGWDGDALAGRSPRCFQDKLIASLGSTRGWINGLIGGRMDQPMMDGLMDGRVADGASPRGRMDRPWMDGLMDGWVCGRVKQ